MFYLPNCIQKKLEKKVELEELNALLFSLLKARMRAPPGYSIAPVGPM